MNTKWTNIPADLFIPPDALEILLESFTGPLDLLLYLIKRQHLDILDIPITQITEQYLHYIHLMEVKRLELAAEYLLMAAMLAEIKSKLLLPPVIGLTEEIEEDPRQALIKKLQLYEQFKEASANLDKIPRMERDVFPVIVTSQLTKVILEPFVELASLSQLMQQLLVNQGHEVSHQISKEPLSVRERMSLILTYLDSQTTVAFRDLYTVEEGHKGLLVALLAILELAKEALIVITQVEPFSPYLFAGCSMTLVRIIEALLMSTTKPLMLSQIQEAFTEDEKPDKMAIKQAIDTLIQEYSESAVTIKLLASGYCFQTKMEYNPWINRLYAEKPPKYSRALLETLAIIAYRQPVTRADIEAIRGVAVNSSIMRTLIERDWIKAAGQRDVPGKPSVYVTTPVFLDYFNLTSLNELPVLHYE